MSKETSHNESFPTPGYFLETAKWRDFLLFNGLTFGYSAYYTFWGNPSETLWVYTLLHTAGQIAPITAILTTLLSVGEYIMLGLAQAQKDKWKEEGREEVRQWYKSRLEEKGIILSEPLSVPLQEELKVYNTNKEKLLAEHEDKFVLIKGSKIIDVFETEDDAIQEGFNRFSYNTPIFVRKIQIEEPVAYIRGLFSCIPAKDCAPMEN